MSAADRRPLASRDTRWARRIASMLARSSVTPNQISSISIVFAALGAIALVDARPLALVGAAIGVQLRLLCNLIDGMVAIEGGKQSATGALYNEFPDRIADSLLLVALGYACGVPWLGWLAALMAALTAYVRATGGALGLAQDFRGPMAKPQRMAVLTVACLAGAAEMRVERHALGARGRSGAHRGGLGADVRDAHARDRPRVAGALKRAPAGRGRVTLCVRPKRRRINRFPGAAARPPKAVYHARPNDPSIHPYRRIFAAMTSSLFTSESVSEGHPDKVADQISDAVLDAILAQDKRARVACETMVKTGVAIVAGEITTSAWVDIEAITRKVICDIGYTNSEVGFDGHTCGVLNLIGKQSPDINQGVDRRNPEEQGAGDQGLMFGYATNETREMMPAAIYYSHRLVEQQAKVRKAKRSSLPWLRPDAKSQVTLRYENDKVVAIDAVVLSTQHDPSVKQKDLKEGVMELVIKPMLPSQVDPQGHEVPHQSDRQVRHRRSGRRLRPDRPQDHRRHLRRLGTPRRRRVLGKGSVEGRSLGRVRRALRRQEHRRGRHRGPLRDPGQLCDRRGASDIDLGDDVRHRQDRRRQDREADPQALRSASVRDPQDARSGASDVSADRLVRSLRPRAVQRQARQRRDVHGVLVGEDRQGRRAARGRQDQVSRPSVRHREKAASGRPFRFHGAASAGSEF